MLQPEYGYWFCERFSGHFIGVHVHAGVFNVGKVTLDSSIVSNLILKPGLAYKLKECNLSEGCIIISIYTEDNIKYWRSRQNNTSPNWISGYDAGMKITLNNLYDIKRKPTLYLLDKNKKVLLKDTSIEKIMEVLVDLKNKDLSKE